jgi:Right handed beta helix region
MFYRFRPIIALLLASLPYTAALAETTLTEALAAAGPGTVISLPPGDYGTLTLENTGGDLGTPLVVQAADPANPPRFSGMILNNAAHVVLDGLSFKYSFAAGDPIWKQPFTVVQSGDVTIRNSLFDGDVARGMSALDNGFGWGIGLSVRLVDGFVLETSEIKGFERGLAVAESANITIRANEIHALRTDGMNVAQVTDMLIADNYIHDFLRSMAAKDHADMIQFWTAGTTSASQRITIRDNVLNSGDGAYTQSIFIRNERVDQGEAGYELFYRDVLITGNVIINAHLHGITVGETDGLTIANNTLIQNPASKGPEDNPIVFIPQIRVADAARDVHIRRNVSHTIDPPPRGSAWSIEDNYAVQNQSRRDGGFYDLVFVNPAQGDPHDLASFSYRTDGALAGMALGAARLDTPHPTITAGRPAR